MPTKTKKSYSHWPASIIHFLGLFFAISTTAQICGEGCLKCDGLNNCLICDVQLNFVLSSGSCIPSTLQNCLIPIDQKSCFMCKEGFYLSDSKLCVAPTRPISHCRFYKSDKACQICQQEYFPSNDSCTKVTIKVLDCVEYAADGKCKRCETGYLSPDQSTCSKLPTSFDLNCAFYFFPYICSQCKRGYAISENIYSNDLLSLNFQYAVLRKKVNKSNIGYMNPAACQKVKENLPSNNQMCSGSIYQPEKCFECPAGKVFSPLPGVCVDNPVPLVTSSKNVANCFFLNIKSECEICNEGFFLHFSRKICLPHSKTADNCLVMSQRNIDECFICSPGYYLSGDGVCNSRVNNDKNCLTFSFFHDKCAVCQPTYVATSSNEGCVKAIPNCAVHLPGLNSVTCTTCQSGFYLILQECILLPEDKQVAGCVTYDPNSLLCLYCEDGKILIKDTGTGAYTCVSQSSNAIFQTCQFAELTSSVYSCKTCLSNGFKIQRGNNCMVDSSFPVNCVEAWPNNSCRICAPGYFLATNTGTCIEGADAQCALYSTQASDQASPSSLKCLLCSPGYFLALGICFNNQQTVDAQNCFTKDPAGNCLLCKAGYSYSVDLTKNFREAFGCESTARFPTIPENCASIKYSINPDGSKSFSCLACKQNYYFELATNSCITCANDCTFINSNLEVEVDNASECLVKIDGQCVQGKFGSLPYYIIPDPITIVQGPFYFEGSLLEKVDHIAITDFVSGGSDKISAIFYADSTAQAADQPIMVTCKFGWARSFEAATLTKSSNDCDVRIKNCLLNNEFTWNSYKKILSSCFRCNNSQVIHILSEVVLVADVQDIGQYLSSDYQGTNIPSVFCAPDTLIDSQNKVDNCIAYSLVSSTQKNCIACEAMYKATVTNGFISACSLIENCANSKTGGFCEECETGYALSANRLSCVESIGFVNCRKLDTQGNCAECLPGFYWNESNCVSMFFYDCIRYGKNECLECKNPALIAVHDRISALNDLVKCVASPPATVPPNCDLADVNGKCVRCSSGFLPNLNGNCFVSNLIANCQLYDTLNTTCLKCAKGFVFDPEEKKCIHRYLAQPALTCPENYPSPIPIKQGLETRCSNLTFANCEGLNSYSLFSSGIIACAKCSNGYKTVDISANQIFDCIILEPIAHCQRHLTDTFLNFRCLACETGYFLTELGICAPRPIIPKCLDFEINSTACKLCDDGFFIENGVCSQRLIVFDFCIEYHLYLDECITFDPSYQYFFLYNSISLNKPTKSNDSAIDPSAFYGISDCVQYSFPTICQICNDQTYLDPVKNACIQVIQKISNCALYSDEVTCSSCNSGFALNKNTCVEQKGQNCLVADANGKCIACPLSFPVLQDSNCVKSPSSANCKVFTNQNNCLLCNQGYYQKDFQCFKVDKEISNCLEYASANGCSICASGFFVNINQQCSKNPDFDSFCEAFAISVSKCAGCGEGFYLQNGSCIKCGVNFESCSVCDPNVPSVCLMCKSGFWMDSKGNCKENVNAVSFKPVIVISFE